MDSVATITAVVDDNQRGKDPCLCTCPNNCEPIFGWFAGCFKATGECCAGCLGAL